MMAISGETDGIVGNWKLEGNQLVIDMRAVTNKFGMLNIFRTMNTSMTNRIAKLTDTRMVWREVRESSGMKLKRVRQYGTR
jgi:hypothetical protein